jgi:hypothetical protein
MVRRWEDAMRTLIFGLAIAAGFTTTSFAQNAVNIVAPSDGQQYPRNIPNGGNKVWVEFSFNTLCFDQFYKAE